jgi:ATP-dependent Clp protease ATP-binding subunit ClpA
MTDFSIYRDRFAESGIRVLEQAINESRRRQQNYVSFGHILKALGAEEATFFKQTLADLRAEPPLTEEFLDRLIESSPHHTGRGIRISPQVSWLFRHAMKVARSSRRERIEAADLISGFVNCIKAGAPWLGEREGKRIGLAFVSEHRPYFYVTRL